jgi:hypothetical protein
MIANVCLKRTRLVTEQTRKSVVNCLCLSESESNMENSLDEGLCEWQSTAPQMEHVGQDGRRLIAYRSGDLAGKEARCIGERKGIRPRQRVCLALVRSWVDKCIDCNLGDIPNIDKSGST